MKYSEKLVRCNVCQDLFPREKNVEYSAGACDGIKIPCSKCKKGYLWLFDIEVNEERMKRERKKLNNPTNGEKISNGIHKGNQNRPDRKANYGTRLEKGFKMLGND